MHVAIALIPALPLAGFVITLLLGRNALARRPEVASLAAVTGSWVLSMVVVAHVFGHHTQTIDVHLFSWVSAGSFQVQWGYYVDALAAVMLIVVSTIGMLVHYYSIGYMRGDGGYYRFFAYLNLFMFAMFTLVLADNYLLMFLGWEGVGLCSYLLISFWFHKKSASQAGKKAFLVNRVGDWGFTLGVFLMFVTFGTLQFSQVFAHAAHVSPGLVTWISLLLFVGAVGKSAQFPLHVWLPDAMEGPTPVSALIHAATMVNAGVYMIARSYPLVSHSHTAMLVVMGVGCFTAIYAACIALTQNDIKKVIAYSTISSLGFMFMALGAGAWVAGIFYLFAHGFFKGLLFLGSGSVIHAMSGEQDMRHMGGLRKKLPLTFWTMMVGALANVGLFPFAGFWAKDEILGGAFSGHYYVVWLVGLVTAFVTAVFMFRLMFLTFWGENRADAEVQHHIHESSAVDDRAARHPRRAGRGARPGDRPAARRRLAAHLPAPGLLQSRERALRLGRHRWRPHAPVARRGRARHRHVVAGLPAAARAAGASRRSRALGLPGVAAQVLYGRDLRRRCGASGHGLRLVAVDVRRRQGGRRRRQRHRRRLGRLRARPAAAADRPRPELRVRRLRRPVRARHHRPLRLEGLTVGWHQQAGFPILSVITYLPLVGVVIIALFGRGRPTFYKVVSLVVTLAAFALSIVLLLRLHANRPGMQFVENVIWIKRFNIHYGFGIDGISALFIFLTTLLGFIVIIASWHYVKDRERGFFATLLLLQVGMTGVFCATDLFLFYVFWEAMLIPMYFIIGIWGGPRKIYAAIKFFLFTLVGSVLMLVAIIALV